MSAMRGWVHALLERRCSALSRKSSAPRAASTPHDHVVDMANSKPNKTFCSSISMVRPSRRCRSRSASKIMAITRAFSPINGSSAHSTTEPITITHEISRMCRSSCGSAYTAKQRIAPELRLGGSARYRWLLVPPPEQPEILLGPDVRKNRVLLQQTGDAHSA